MKKQDIIKALKARGINRNSRSFTDYETAKRLISKHVLMPAEYDQAIRHVVNYLRV